MTHKITTRTASSYAYVCKPGKTLEKKHSRPFEECKFKEDRFAKGMDPFSCFAKPYSKTHGVHIHAESEQTILVNKVIQKHIHTTIPFILNHS